MTCACRAPPGAERRRTWFGAPRSDRDAPEIDGLVFIEGDARIGDIIPVKIMGAMSYDLTGVPERQSVQLAG